MDTKAATGRGSTPLILPFAVIRDGERPVGSVYGLFGGGAGDAGKVGGMWVEPAWRAQGVGAALLREAIGWARTRKLSALSLWAPAHSAAALALYRSAGFGDTGVRRPLPSNPARQIVEMVVQLRATE